jgi:hypothetical protein
MDQLKQFLAVVKKQHFWILCGLVVLIGFVTYAIASSKMNQTYVQTKGKISQTSTELDPLLSGTEHPNRDWAELVQKKTEDLRNNVRDAWEALYNEQKQQVFVWPAALGKDFVAAFNQPTANTDSRKMVEYCERYQAFVKTELRHLGQIVDAEWVEEGDDSAPHRRPMTRGPAGPGRPGLPDTTSTEPQKIYTVNWDSEDEKRLTLAYDWQDVAPSSQDVRYAQEELWVMDALCKAIARTNTGARGPYEAIVRDINKMLVGYDAVDKNPLGEESKRIRHLSRAVPAATAAPVPAGPAGVPTGSSAMPLEAPKRPVRHKTGNGDEDQGPRTAGMTRYPRGPGMVPPGVGPPNMPGGAQMPGTQGAAGATAADDPDAWLKENRYVAPNGHPLSAAEMRNPPVAEYNLMEFRLDLTVDQVRWEKLLLELCNSPLPLEIREVRINVSDDDSVSDRNMGRRPGSMRVAAGETGVQHNMPIEIRGVAYLMNPPNFEKLGLTAGSGAPGQTAPGAAPANPAGGKAPAAGATPGSTPAAAPGASPTAPSGAADTTGTALPATAVPAATTGPATGATGKAPGVETPPTVPDVVAPKATNPAAVAPGIGPPTGVPAKTPGNSAPGSAPPAATASPAPPAK